MNTCTHHHRQLCFIHTDSPSFSASYYPSDFAAPDNTALLSSLFARSQSIFSCKSMLPAPPRLVCRHPLPLLCWLSTHRSPQCILLISTLPFPTGQSPSLSVLVFFFRSLACLWPLSGPFLHFPSLGHSFFLRLSRNFSVQYVMLARLRRPPNSLVCSLCGSWVSALLFLPLTALITRVFVSNASTLSRAFLSEQFVHYDSSGALYTVVCALSNRTFCHVCFFLSLAVAITLAGIRAVPVLLTCVKWPHSQHALSTVEQAA